MEKGEKMVVGVTLLNVEPGKEKQIHTDLTERTGVKEVLHVFG